MKTNSILSLLFALLITTLAWQCAPKDPAPIDYDQASRDLMTTLKPQISGQWTIRQVEVKYKNEYGHRQAGLTKDTTFKDLAVLTIEPTKAPRTSPIDTRQGEYEGNIQFNGKTYPIWFNMYANSQWIQTKKGPQTFLLLDYNFPAGSHVTEQEEFFLKYLGLIGENFSLETTTGQPIMTWRGLNRGIQRMELIRR